MEWAYIAGYFDGEGHVGFHPQRGREHFVYSLQWYNSNIESLDVMREFMQCGYIHKRTKREGRNHDVFVLIISQRQQILSVIQSMLPYLIVKREAAEKLRDYLLNVKFKNRGPVKITDFSADDLQDLYWQKEQSLSQIAKEKGCSPALVCKAMKLLGIVAREAGGSFLEGTKKSPETIERMKAAQ